MLKNMLGKWVIAPVLLVGLLGLTAAATLARPIASPGDTEVTVAARAIGITATTLSAALRNGQTVAQVARQRGVNPQTVIDAVVSHALTEAQLRSDYSKLSVEQKTRFASQTRARVTAWVNGTTAAGEDTGKHASAPSELDIAARTIGISTSALGTALRNGQTVAQVAQAHGIRPQAVIDAVVRDALAKAQARPDWAKTTDTYKARHIEQTRTRVTAWVNGTIASGEDRGAAARTTRSELDVAAGTIGLTTTALATALKNGQSIAQVAQARGVNPQTVIDAVVRHSIAQAQARPDWAKTTDAYKARFAEQTRTRVTAWAYRAGSAKGEDTP